MLASESAVLLSAGWGFVGLEAGSLHSNLRFWVLHKYLPDVAGAGILSHQHGDSKVNSNYVRVIPIGQRIEGVDKTINRPCPGIACANRPQHPNRFFRKKRQGASCGRWSNSSVDRSDGRGAAPDDVTFFR